MSTTIEVTETDLHDLLKTFEKKSFDAGSCEEGSLEHDITKRCEYLFKKDYAVIELDNTNGILSPRYPSRIFIPEYELSHNATPENSVIENALNQNSPSSCAEPSTTTTSTAPTNSVSITTTTTNTIYEDPYDINKVKELITMAKYARCRQRFVVPVIMYRDKYICRSATISINAETYGRKVVDYAYDCLNGTNYSEQASRSVDDENNDNTEDSLMNQALNEPSPFSYEEVIKSDIQLLNALKVSTIVDLMVEKRKIKYFMAVSSSEKADPDNHYENFNLLSLPYPGCEFFKKFSENNFMATNLYYDWKQSFNDANICLPILGPTTELNINWSDYKSWDLVLITQNYLKACLKYIEEKSGVLIHCISGWDRTPLFISLVRLSLWADGHIHKSLSALQMTYFTLAYDWYLFGHQLPDRQKRREDIMFFCFEMLKYISDEEFSIFEHRKRTKTSSSSGSSGSSIIVLKHDISDDEPLKEEDPIGCEQDSNDSFSNSSNCDISITDNFYTTPTATTTTTPQDSCNNIATNNPIINRSPNSKRSKTSPISVPGASATRQRLESTSSNSSWQVVTETGSIDSLMNGSYMMRSASKNNLPLTAREKRLNTVRAIFIKTYGQAVGFKFIEGSGMTLTKLIGTLADQLSI